jgi:hypothetical protein
MTLLGTLGGIKGRGLLVLRNEGSAYNGYAGLPPFLSCPAGNASA